jgi:two-component system, NarL family, invasion response regulator UvrY
MPVSDTRPYQEVIMINVLIADDHVIVRKGMLQVLSSHTDIQVTDEVGTGQEAIDKIRKNKYDVVILDISLPGKSGLEVLKQVKSEYPSLPVLILSMYPEDHYAVRVLKAGGAGYITKENASADLANAIRTVVSGKKYITPSLAEKLAEEMSPNNIRLPHAMLTDREFNILCLIAKGRSSSQIADEFSLSVKTIATYRSRLLQKMGMKSNSELTFYAAQHRLVE